MTSVSVVITTYNRPVKILMRAVTSVLNQTYKPDEVIVVNDCPENLNLSKEINQELKRIDERIIYLVLKENQGACAARNAGLNIAKGEYIGFLDDDDEWLPNKLEEQLNLFDSDTGIVGVSSYVINNKKVSIHHPLILDTDSFKAILKNNYLGSCSFPLIRTDILKKVGRFDTNLKACQDYDVWIRILAQSKGKFLRQPLVNYYISNDSTFKADTKKYNQAKEYIFNKYKYMYAVNKSALSYRLNDEAIKTLIHEKKIKEYFILKKRAIKCSPLCLSNYFLVCVKIYWKLRNKLGMNRIVYK